MIDHQTTGALVGWTWQPGPPFRPEVSPDFHLVISVLQVALEVLSQHPPPEWFLWLDCDTLVTNRSISIPDLLVTYGIGEDVHFVVAEASDDHDYQWKVLDVHFYGK